MLQKIQRKISKKLNEARDKGVWFTVKKIFRDNIYLRTRTIIFKRDLSQPLTLRRLSIAGAQLTIIKKRDANFNRLVKADPASKHYYEEYIDKGVVICPLIKDDVLLAVNFVALEDFYDRHRYRHLFKLKPGECYQFGGKVVPEFQSTSAAIFGLGQIYEKMFNEGYKTIYTVGDMHNPLAMKFHFKTDFDETGEQLIFHNLLGYRWSKKNTYKDPVRSQFVRDRKKRN